MTAKEKILTQGGPGWTTKIAVVNLAARRRERPSQAWGAYVCTYGPAPVVPTGLPLRMWQFTKRRKAAL